MTKMKKKIKRYHYTECGLDYIYLLNGYLEKDTPYGKAISITSIDALHKVIGEIIIYKPNSLSGAEIRFLRHELDWSQKRLSEKLGVDSQTVGRWERGETPISSTAISLLRVLYALYALDDGADDVKLLVDTIAELDANKIAKELSFEKVESEWKAAA